MALTKPEDRVSTGTNNNKTRWAKQAGMCLELHNVLE